MANTPVLIYFVGLIAHLHFSNARQVAVLVAEPHHSKQLIVDYNAVTAYSFPRLPPERDQNQRSHFSLEGVNHISIEGIDPGPVTLNDPDKEVIHLGDLSNLTPQDKLAPAIDAETATGFVFLHMPGGELSPNGYYATNWELDGKALPCVPSRILFKSTTAGSSITFRGDNQMYVTVKVGYEITIANLPRMAMSGHSTVYASLMALGDPQLAKRFAVPRPLLACNKAMFDPSSLEIYKADTADCTDTHFP